MSNGSCAAVFLLLVVMAIALAAMVTSAVTPTLSVVSNYLH